MTTLHVLRRGWRTSPELREGMGAILVLAFVAAAGRVALPVLLQVVVDHGVSWATSVGGVALVATTSFAAQAMRVRLSRNGERALAGLRRRAFRHIHRLSLATQSDERRGALVSRVTSDVETMSQFLAWGGIAWLTSTTMMLAVFVVMLVYDWRLALVAVVVVVPMAMVLHAVQRRLARAYLLVRDRVGEMLGVVAEAITGVTVVRAYGAEAHVRSRVHERVRTSRDAGIRAGTISAFLFPIGDVFAALAVAAVVVVGVVLGPAGGLSAGELVAFVFLVLLFLEPVAEMTEIVDQTQTAVAGWRKVLDVLDTPVEVPEPEPGVVLPPGPPELRLEDVWFSYRGGDGPWVVGGVDAAIGAGRRVAVVGATGSGKTTLAKLLTRLADPARGRVLVAGVDLRQVRPSSLRSTLVMVPQEGFLFDTTIGDNVRFGRPDATDEDVALAFTELGLTSWLASLPHGLDTPVGSRGEHLSVGERQLVSLARAYVANPACLILDEATSAVDPATEVRLARAVQSLSRGRTSVTIAHRLSTAERADEVLVLAAGELVERGTHAELLARNGVYAEMHRRWVVGIGVDAG